MSSEELIFRQSASGSLLSFTEFASSVLNQGRKDCQEIMPHEGAHLATKDVIADSTDKCSTWSKAYIQQIIEKNFLKNMAKAMKKDVSIQKEWISLLWKMVCILYEVPALNSFRPLCSEDTKVDFFNNILHFKIHRRTKAMEHFRDVINSGNVSEGITVKIFVPLFFNMLFDVKGEKGEQLRDACVESLLSIAGQMQWVSYLVFLMRCFREMSLKEDSQEILSHLICSLLNKFHFYDASSIQPVKDGEYGVLNSGNTEFCTKYISPSKIQVYLQKAVLHQVQKLLTSNSGEVNVSISIAAMKVVRLLPMETLESQLPMIIHHISKFLKHQLESTRDKARYVLAACAEELGLEYLHVICKILRGLLGADDFKHVYSLIVKERLLPP